MATTYHPHIAHGDRTLPQKVAIGMGILFLFIGVLGFVAPGFMGMHLSFSHNLIHALSGAVSVWIGLAANPMSAYRFAVWFGAFYGLLGVAGFVFGETGLPSVGHIAEDRFLFRIIPGSVEFATNDHFIHILIGAAYLGTALSWKNAQEYKTGRKGMNRASNKEMFGRPDDFLSRETLPRDRILGEQMAGNQIPENLRTGAEKAKDVENEWNNDLYKKDFYKEDHQPRQ